MTPPDGARPRIAIVTTVFPPSMGGAERYHFMTARDLAGHAEVSVFTADLCLEGGPPAVLPGATIEYLPSGRFLGERRIHLRPLWRALARARPDLVWTNCPSLTADLAGFFAWSHGIPWAVTYHADLDQRSALRRAYTRGEHWWMRRAAWFLVQSERYRRLELRRGIRSDRLAYAPPGPYIEDGEPPVRVEGDRIRLGRAGSEHPLLFVGTLDLGHPYKGLDRLLRALVGRSMCLEVVGDGSRRAEFEREAKALGLGERVRFLGRLSDDALAGRFREAWALVIPSTSSSEGFAAVAVEAAAYGCPVVASSWVPAAEVLARGGGAIVYDAEDPTGLGRALDALWGDPRARDAAAAGALTVAGTMRWSVLMPRHTGVPLRLATDHHELHAPPAGPNPPEPSEPSSADLGDRHR